MKPILTVTKLASLLEYFLIRNPEVTNLLISVNSLTENGLNLSPTWFDSLGGLLIEDQLLHSWKDTVNGEDVLFFARPSQAPLGKEVMLLGKKVLSEYYASTIRVEESPVGLKNLSEDYALPVYYLPASISIPTGGLTKIREWIPGVQPSFRGSLYLVGVDDGRGLDVVRSNLILPSFFKPTRIVAGCVVIYDQDGHLLCAWNDDATPMKGFELMDRLCRQFLAE